MTLPPSEFPADDVRSYMQQPEAWAQISLGLKRIAVAIVGNERDAEDVVQGAWLEALNQPHKRQTQGWLKRLVRFRALDVLRNKGRDPVRIQDEMPDVEDTGGESMRWKLEAQREVLEAVNALKEPYLSTVMLRYFEAKGPAQIAAQLGVPERTVKTRLTRAHEMLRTRLGARYQDRFGNWAPALLAFSGTKGLKASSLTVPTAGLLLMKNATLVAAALAAVVLIPMALQLTGEEAEGLENTSVPDAELVEVAAAKQSEPQAETYRAPLPTAQPAPVAKATTFAFAFPPRLDSEVGNLVIRARWSDGSPAENIKFGVMPWDSEEAFLMRQSVYTHANGQVEIGQLAPGEVRVGSSRTPHIETQVVAGETTQLEFEVPPGVMVRGRVLDPAGNPVAGASIYLADSAGGDTQTQATSFSDHLGNYEVRDVRVHHFVSARATGFAPSLQVETRGEVGGTMELDLPRIRQLGHPLGLGLEPRRAAGRRRKDTGRYPTPTRFSHFASQVRPGSALPPDLPLPHGCRGPFCVR